MGEAHGGNARGLRTPLASTVFWRSWFGLIDSAELRTVAQEAGLEVAFLPHPNMQAHFSARDVPSWVRIYSYQRSDVQELLVQAAVTVTDYSSQAFEAAYLECPVVYYQFDRADFFAGTHVYRKGSWDYDDDGFGPVASTSGEALAAIKAAVGRGAPEEPYLTRMRSAFPHRDGRCCERTFDSIVALNQPVTYEQGYRFLDQQVPKSTSKKGSPSRRSATEQQNGSGPQRQREAARRMRS